MSDKLNKNILATIIYYDALDYPLTVFEIWKYLIRTDYSIEVGDVFAPTLLDVIKHIYDKHLAKFIEHSSGFYFLKGRGFLVEKRIVAGKISTVKIRKLQRIVNLLRFVPFVRMIGVTGALAMKNAKKSSDLDLLIVLQAGKIWTGRTLVTMLLHLVGKRRHGKNIADRACLNFFVTEESLEIITKDLFSANEYMFMFPLFGWEVFNRFQMKNQWIKNMKPNYDLSMLAPLRTIKDTVPSRRIRKFGELIFSSSWIEENLKAIEKKQIMQNPKTHQEGSLVYANDDALMFLPSPHGPAIFEKFKDKIEQLSAN
ncbi:MAG: hypothetical protein WCI36_00185 [bacterium]